MIQQTNLFVFRGTDTIACTLATIYYFLGQNKDLQESIRKDLMKILEISAI